MLPIFTYRNTNMLPNNKWGIHLSYTSSILSIIHIIFFGFKGHLSIHLYTSYFIFNHLYSTFFFFQNALLKNGFKGHYSNTSNIKITPNGLAGALNPYFLYLYFSRFIYYNFFIFYHFNFLISQIFYIFTF
jgi:hypothetical protein